MPNAHRECNSPRTVRNCQDSPTSETNRRESTRTNAETASYCLTGFRREPGPSARQDVAERFEPFAERSPKRPGQLVAAGRLAIEGRPPFDEGPVSIHDRGNAQGGLETGNRQRRRVAEFVGLRPLDVELRQQPLPDVPALVQHAPDSADGIAGFAVLDLTGPGTADPNRIVVEITNDFPNFSGGLFEHGAVIGLGHRSIPWFSVPIARRSWAAGRLPPTRSPMFPPPRGHPDQSRGHRSNRLKFPGKPPIKRGEVHNHR